MEPAAVNVAPNFAFRRNLTASELQRVVDPCVIFEHSGIDSDYAPFWVYTVGGMLDGAPLAEGCTVGGDVIVMSGLTCREEADEVAVAGLFDVILALDAEKKHHEDAQAALGRLSTIGAVERLELASRKGADRSDAFDRDAKLIETLRGEDIVLAGGGFDPEADDRAQVSP